MKSTILVFHKSISKMPVTNVSAGRLVGALVLIRQQAVPGFGLFVFVGILPIPPRTPNIHTTFCINISFSWFKFCNYEFINTSLFLLTAIPLFMNSSLNHYESTSFSKWK